MINQEIETDIKTLKTQNIHRTLENIQHIDGASLTIKNKKLINFSSNDYLGLAQHPIKKENQNPIGSAASPLVSGRMQIHEDVEKRISELVNMESSLVFSSGFAANLALLPALTNENDLILSDELNHASIIDACQLSKADTRIYLHRNLKHLEVLLNEKKGRRKFIVTESIFSMDGDLAPLKELHELSIKYNAPLIVDEAHAFGLLNNGKSLSAHLGIKPFAQIIPFGKALGIQGAAIATSTIIRDYLIQKARPFIFSTAPSPFLMEIAFEHLLLLENAKEKRENLNKLIKIVEKEIETLKENQTPFHFKKEKNISPIFPIIIGEASKTIEIANKLYEDGFLVKAIRPPTVSENTSRLRLTINNYLTEKDIKNLFHSLKQYS